MAINFMLDESGILEKYVRELIRREKSFHLFEHIRFLFVWKLGDPEMDKEKRWLEASIRRLPSRERDVYGRDVELLVYQQWWNEKTHKQRARLIYHELLHVNIQVDEALTPLIDDDGRVKIEILPHDLVITGFKSEWVKFGPPTEYVTLAGKLYETLVKEKKLSVT